MKTIIAFFLIIPLLTVNVLAQDSIYVIHPIVGKQINKYAKKKYYLFPEIKDSGFKYCIVKSIKGSYYVYSYFKNDSVSTKEVKLSTLDEYHRNIEKLDQYYSYQLKKDSADKSKKPNILIDKNTLSSPSLKNDLLPSSISPQTKKELKRDERMKADAERMNNFKKGTEAAPGRIDLNGLFNKNK